eukprot:5629399-Pyramimonas_sp.AAC.1
MPSRGNGSTSPTTISALTFERVLGRGDARRERGARARAHGPPRSRWREVRRCLGNSGTIRAIRNEGPTLRSPLQNLWEL